MMATTGNEENVHPNIIAGKKKLPAYMQSLNYQEKEENFKIIDNMNKKISYMKNPRFKVNKAPIIFTKVSVYSIEVCVGCAWAGE